ncbi:potassium channel family protein [Pseudomonas sp. GOM6]|uniref:potassium channel family protein n=1 Tax=unclassified Pseudomonas TaxID=196821 RepID=UPI00240A553F|nr:potassium channel family protein [Pseudomonas sp. GOM6]MDG1582629.1 potassium channel family protein [Pseudomonas sp. GOM6]
MLMNLMIGLPVMLLCLLLQALVVAISLRYYVRYKRRHSEPSISRHIGILALVMLLMLLGNFLQMGIWASLFVLLDEFETFAQALYFSGVTFATLGYGDVVLSPQWQLLSPLEAANGILMFGVSTAVMTAAVGDEIKRYAQQLRKMGG